jgi:hypothetical protein
MLKAKLPAREGWEFFEGKRLRREGNVSVASPRGFATVFFPGYSVVRVFSIVLKVVVRTKENRFSCMVL